MNDINALKTIIITAVRAPWPCMHDHMACTVACVHWLTGLCRGQHYGVAIDPAVDGKRSRIGLGFGVGLGVHLG